jgi:hypothetical protein
VADAQARLSQLEDENAALQADVDALNTDAEIEKLAREKLGYVRPGETAYVVLDPPGAGRPAEAAEPLVADDRTWVEQIWDFVSGGDQEGG